MDNRQTNNEKFNAMLNSCDNPRAVYNVLRQLSLEQLKALNEYAQKLQQEQNT